jgi:hypothetical protein
MVTKSTCSFRWNPATFEEAQHCINDPQMIPYIQLGICLGLLTVCPPPANDQDGIYEVQNNDGRLIIVRVN